MISWQDKCGTEDRDEAVRFFTDIGIAAEDVYFDDEGDSLRKNIHSGFQQRWQVVQHPRLGEFSLRTGQVSPGCCSK
jgi:hypothetical protein